MASLRAIDPIDPVKFDFSICHLGMMNACGFGKKIGDVDPRDDAEACYMASDKALAMGGAALEAILSRVDIRRRLW